MTFYASYPAVGGGGGVPTYTNLAAFPSAVGAGNGALAIALDTDILYISNGTVWEVLADPTISPLAITALTGDGTATGPGSVPLTLATVNGNVGTFGSASSVMTQTVNAKGLTTAAASVAIQIAESQVTNLVSDLAAKQSTTLTNTHLLVGNASNVATDVAASGDLTLANTGAFTFNTVNSNVGTFGTATQVPQVTVNAKGLATAASNVAIQIAESQVTNLVTDLAAKQSTTLTNTHILVGNGSNIATDVAMSGDATIANTGALTIANLAVTNAKIANTTIDLTTKVTGVLPTANGGTGQNSTATFPTSGVVVTEAASETLTNKTINGSNNTITNVSLTTGVTGTLPLLNGGTGTAAASANAAFNALSPLTTKGDILGFSSVNARLPVGSNDFVLVADSGQTLGVKWAANTAASLVSQGAAGLVASAGQLLGTNTNDNAAAGYVGEVLSVSTSASYTNFPASSTFGDLGSLAITAGDWDIFYSLNAQGSGDALIQIGVTTTPGNSLTGLAPNTGNAANNYMNGAQGQGTVNLCFRLSLSGTTTYYAKISASYVLQVQYVGIMWARRRR